MRGSIKRRSAGSWTIILDRGYVVDPATGKPRRQQQWLTVRGAKRDAEAHLAELLKDVNDGTFVVPSKRSFGEWMSEWLDKAIKPPARTQRAYDTYCGVARIHIAPSLAGIRLQQLKSLDLERLYAEKREAGLAPATVEKIHNVAFGALKAAVLAGLLKVNVAERVVGKPVRVHDPERVAQHCWTAEEAAAFLAVARKAGAQQAAFYSLGLTTGMRKSELCGLRWSEVDLANARVSVRRQLLRTKAGVQFTGVKGKQARSVDISADVVALLKRHRASQGALKLRNRQRYHDLGLVFAKEWADKGRRHDILGEPLQANNIGEREFATLIEKAGVRRIKFHGMRHTCATLMLANGTPAKVVQERLGHKKIATTLDVYAHVLPSMQRDAANALADALRSATPRRR